MAVATRPAATVPRSPWALLVAAVLGTALPYMSDDMLNLAVPSLARDLGVSASGVQWVLNAYYLPLVAFVLVAGALGDVVGHRRVFVLGLTAFGAGAVLCATAPGVTILIAGRAVQGFAAAMVLAAGLALVTKGNPPERRDKALGQFFGLVAAVPALGPFLSGALVDWLSWRWLFVVPLVLPAGALLLARGVAETPRGTGHRPDLAGSLAALAALSALSTALIVGPGAASRGPVVVGALLAAVALWYFVRAERRAADPLLPLALFRRRAFVGANIVWLLACMTQWGAMFFVAVTLQATVGVRPMTVGLLLTPIYLIMMVGSPIAGAAAGRMGRHRVVVAGLGTYTVGLWWLSTLDATAHVVTDVLPRLVLFAVGTAIFTAPLATATMSALDERDQGVASGVNNAMGQLAGLLAIIVLPALAGLAGASSFTGEVLAAAYPRALRAAAVLAAAGIPIAVWALVPRSLGASADARTPHGKVAARSNALRRWVPPPSPGR